MNSHLLSSEIDAATRIRSDDESLEAEPPPRPLTPRATGKEPTSPHSPHVPEEIEMCRCSLRA
uniref:Uncharacterized protein n=1 Tax=Arundo donax TaxID=35708 RepID=A0A0A8Y6E5_ARUDO